MSNQKFKNKFFNILRNKEGLMLKLCQLINCYVKEIVIENYAENVYQTLVADLHLIWGIPEI